MGAPRKLLIEGLDRLGKDTLIQGILDRHGYYQVLHFTKPLRLDFYARNDPSSAFREYQDASFRTLFQLLQAAPAAKILCNRAHLGECVYAPIYRGYSGEYVFDIERAFDAHQLPDTRFVLLTENFGASKHFEDDGLSLGGAEKRRDEQKRFLAAFEQSTIRDKRTICVTDATTGRFRPKTAILDEALA